MSLFYVGDVGATVIILLEKTNIDVGTEIRVFVENPLGQTIEWTLEAGELNRTTGIITHLTKVGEIPYEGEYRVQCREVATGIDVGGTIDTFYVYRKLSNQLMKDLIGIFGIIEETA